jgi:hypothetical protein
MVIGPIAAAKFIAVDAYGAAVRFRGAPMLVSAFLVLSACSSGSPAHRTTGSSSPKPSLPESVSDYAERVLPQTLGTLQGEGEAGHLAVGKVEMCTAATSAAPRILRAGDFQLVLANGRHIVASTGAISPALHDGPVRAGECTRGFVNWNVAPDQHPMILDARTGALWEPRCPRQTASSDPCLDVAPKRLPDPSSVDEPEPVPVANKGFVGSWSAHSTGLHIGSAGRGTLFWRTYQTCGEDPPPCDTFAGNSILSGGHATLRLTLALGTTTSGRILSTTDPVHFPIGPLTARLDLRKHELFLSPSPTGDFPFCGQNAPVTDCG